MRLHRFYIQNENFKTLNPGDIFTCKNNEVVRQVSLVLRAQVGDRILFFNETGEIEIMVQGFSKKELVCVMQKHTKPLIQKKRVYILQSLIKKDKFEWVAQKATEIGATDIIPVISERSEKRGVDQKRLQKIVIEATEQSGWGRVPILHNIDSLEKAIMRLKNDKVITFTLDMEGTKTFSKEQNSVAICIGPEGGWSKHDKEIFKKNNVKSINIGDSVLRAETAAIIATYTFINK